MQLNSAESENVKDALQRLLKGLHQTLQGFKVFSEHDVARENAFGEPLKCIASSSRPSPKHKRKRKYLRVDRKKLLIAEEELGCHDLELESSNMVGLQCLTKKKNVPYGKKLMETNLTHLTARKATELYPYQITEENGSFFAPYHGEVLLFPVVTSKKRKQNDNEAMEQCPKSCPKQQQKQSNVPTDQNQPKRRKPDPQEYTKPVDDIIQRNPKLKPKEVDKQQPTGSGKKNGNNKSKGCCKARRCKKLTSCFRGKGKKPEDSQNYNKPSPANDMNQKEKIKVKQMEKQQPTPQSGKKKQGDNKSERCCKECSCQKLMSWCRRNRTTKTKRSEEQSTSKKNKSTHRESLKPLKAQKTDPNKGRRIKAETFEDFNEGKKSPRKSQGKMMKIEDFDAEKSPKVDKQPEYKKPICSVCSEGCKTSIIDGNRIICTKKFGDLRSPDLLSHIESADTISTIVEKEVKDGPYKKKQRILDLDNNLDRSVKADFVLIFILNLEEQFGNLLERFLQSIQEEGMLLECVVSADYLDILFIKVQIPTEVAKILAQSYGVKLACMNPYFENEREARYMCNNTILTTKDPTGTTVKRNRAAVQGDKPKEPTNAERTRVLYELLKITKFSDEIDDFGIWEMKRKGIIADAYPVHDGPYEWTSKGPLNERQLLKKYWASFWKIFSVQPIQHICTYFGPEAAYYFAFMDWYITMLIPAAVLGIIVIIYGWATMGNNAIAKQYCFDKTFSNKIVCPTCANPKMCGYSLFDSCSNFKLTYLLDNNYTIWFGMVMSLWGLLFVMLWIRQQNMLKVSWNLHNPVELDLFRRPGYFKKAQEWSISPVTGQREPQVTTLMELLSKLFVIVGMLIAIFVVLFVLFLLILYRIQLTAELAAVDTTKTTDGTEAQKRSPAVATAAIRISILSSVIIIILGHFFDFVAIFLTNIENPKLQGEYDRSYILKLWLLSCVNHYNMVIYLAFFRSFTYTNPSDLKMWKRFYGINSDICDTSGCLIDIVYYITTLLIVKTIVNAFKQLAIPRLCKKIPETVNRPQWEIDYDLTSNTAYKFSKLQVDSITQFGLVIFLMPAFPLLPLIALIVNVIDVRVNAKGLVQLRRRPIARQICERDFWNHILYAMTFIGIIIHGFVAAFVVNYVERATFHNTKMFKSNVTYLDVAFSNFPINQYPTFRVENSSNSCLYFAKRSSTHPFRRTPYYFEVLGNRLSTVTILVAFAMIGGGILFSAMSIVPYQTKQRINYLENQEVFIMK